MKGVIFRIKSWKMNKNPSRVLHRNKVVCNVAQTGRILIGSIGSKE